MVLKFVIKNHKKSIINWIVNFFKKFHYLQSFNAQNLIQISRCFKSIFACSKQLRVKKCFFKHSFLKIKCAPFLLKIEEDINIDD
jgi:hypothetical protein